jgi:hypothetical protein
MCCKLKIYNKVNEPGIEKAAPLRPVTFFCQLFATLCQEDE